MLRSQFSPGRLSFWMVGAVFIVAVIGVRFLSAAPLAVALQDGCCISPTGQTVSMTVNNPDGTVTQIPNVPWIENMNVSLAMMNANALDPTFTYQTAYYCPYGQYATSIDGFYEGGCSYWALYVNGTMSCFGMDTTLLNPNDAVVWQVQSYDASALEPAADGAQAELLKLHRSKRLDLIAGGDISGDD